MTKTQYDWKSLLPEAYVWLSKVEMTPVSKAEKGSHHIIIADAGENDAFTLDAKSVDAALLAKITTSAKSMGWSPTAGNYQCIVDDVGFTVVPRNKSKTTTKQLDRQIGLDAAKSIKGLKVGTLVFCAGNDTELGEVMDGYANGVYSSQFFKGSYKPNLENYPSKLGFLGSDLNETSRNNIKEFTKSLLFTRFLQDSPPNFMNPVEMASIAEDIAKEGGAVCKILDEKEMAKLGMGSALSVGLSGHFPPRTIIIEIEGEDNSRTACLVGKGLTFDAGGISIKPSAGMEEMKYDMSGGAAVLGAAKYLMTHKPPTKVVCIVGAAENLPSSKATRPGDIVTAMNGKTIEVHNTDAEGRLVLADMLCYANKNYKPELMINIATLTGSVLHALGSAGSAVISNYQETAEHVLKASKDTGEPFWQLPMWPELYKETSGKFADLQNIAKPNVKAGTIMAGMFLAEFVEDTKWAHLDIAGTGWNCQATGYPSTGGSGYGMRTLVQSCLNLK